MATQAQKLDETVHTRILGIEAVKARLHCSRSSVYRLEKKGILHRAKQLEGFRNAGWMSDEVDALVESRRPDGPQQVSTAKSGLANKRAGRDAGKSITPAPRSIEHVIARDDERPELMPTTLRIMGKVVYLHSPSGRLLMEVGKMSVPGAGMKLTPPMISGMQVDDDND